MTIEQLKETAEKLVSFCRNHQEEECLNELYASDAISVEAMAMPGTDSPESVGLDAIRGKHEWWANTMEVHSGSIDGPYYHGTERFSVIFEIDATNKQTDERMAMKEVAIYTLKNGKVAREEFYYQF